MPLCLLARWLGNFTRVRGGGVSMRLVTDSCRARCRCFWGVFSLLLLMPCALPLALCGRSTAASAALTAGELSAERAP